MTNIPPNMNIMGSIIQSQNASKEAAKSDNVRRGQQAQETRQIKRRAEQQQEEVENTEQVDEVVIRRADDRQPDGQETRDEYRSHEKNMKEKQQYDGPENAGGAQSPVEPAPKSPDGPDSPPGTHIDLSV